MTTIPTIAQLKTNILADLQAEFGVVVNSTGLAVFTAIATVFAGILYLYYLSVGKVQKNIWYDTADSIAQGGTLERYGVSILGRWPFAATAGQYTLSVTGSAGAVIPASMVYKSNDSAENPGMLYQIAGPYTMTGSGDVIVVNALKGGIASRLAVGDGLTATAPMANINAAATVTIENVAPVPAETTEQYRQKIGEKVKLVPGSWSAADYRLVGGEIAGVGQTYAYAPSGRSNEADVYLQGTVAMASPGPSVSSGVVAAYDAAIALVRPMTVFLVNTAACPINDIVITITSGTFTPFTGPQQSLILSALTTFINSVHPFIAACDDVSQRNDVIATFNLNSVITAAVPGYGFASVTFTVAGTPSVNWQADNGNIPFLDSVVFV